MTQKSKYPALATLLFTLLLLAPLAAQAAPLHEQGPLVPLIEWFAALLSDARCGVDPSGGCGNLSAPPATEQPDYRCGMDPSGGCLETQGDQIDIGCSFDPGGQCREGSTTNSQIDIGCSFDPNGGGCGGHD